MATSSTIAGPTATNMAGANGLIVQEAPHSMECDGNTMTVARQIVESWPRLRESLQKREKKKKGSSFDEAIDKNLQDFNDLISLLDQSTTVAKGSDTRKERATGGHGMLPLQRFLDSNDEWQVSMERESTNGGPDLEMEAEPQSGKPSAMRGKPASPAASSLSLVTDSALSTAVSDETVVIDMGAIQNHDRKRQQLEEETRRDLNEKLCRIVSSGQRTKNIVARATDLIDAGADVNARDEWCEGIMYDELWKDYRLKEGWQSATVLYSAVATGADNAVIRLLLNKGADINKRGGFNATPLRAIAQTDEKDTARLLLNRGADMSIGGGFGCTLLTLVARYGTVGIMELLVERGVQVREADSHNSTALHAAANRGHVGMIKLLLDYGALINVKLRDTSETPLGGAVHMGHAMAVQTLLARGADVRLLRPVMTTYANMTCRERLMGMLREYGADYTCSDVEIPREPGKCSPLYNLVRQGDARAVTPEDDPAQWHEKLVIRQEASPKNGGSPPSYQSDDIGSQARRIADASRPSQMEDTASVVSFQTNSTTKTEKKKSRKFWSRFSSQTTLNDTK